MKSIGTHGRGRRWRFGTAAAVAALSIALVGTACSTDVDETTQEVTNVQGEKLNLTADQQRIVPAKDEAIAATVPQAIRDRGTLLIGQGSGAGNPPFTFPATDDDRVWIGDEVDIATLVAGVLGLKPEFKRASWEGLFLGIDSGSSDVGFSNITVTEDRKDIYDFATYRTDVLSVIVPADSTLKFGGYEDLSGKTIAVSSGTNQEKILVGYADRLKAEGKPSITIKNYQDITGTWSALASRQIDGYFGPNPINAFHDAQVRGTPQETKLVGEVSGAGEDLTGLIAATTKKGNPLINPVRAAINKVIQSGEYQKVLQRWNLQNEAVKTSELNPQGLPRTSS
ncbi:ABC transporter substrate-binding protein [Gordonia soli]|uniref:Putative amino acid ABC transporter substrate-binding protein n=1 Tax=Gordonia soli NBRC 108243 TaxID=1223545 RepID=M0QKM5_9ACTN|nr:ABC transporter substrate-binding protein [Gordonia soli]GAC67972.1 putative amino acid ABC transporter substrate-binding protein [Gordonia soli NBRC 108243]